jgi:hypothetical protein
VSGTLTGPKAESILKKFIYSASVTARQVNPRAGAGGLARPRSAVRSVAEEMHVGEREVLFPIPGCNLVLAGVAMEPDRVHDRPVERRA